MKKSDVESLAAAVRGAKSGDEAAMSTLIQETKVPLSRFLLYLGGSEELAQDVLQETYLYALEHLKDLKQENAALKWLFLIAKNKFLDFKRSPKNKAHAPIETLENAAGRTNEQQELHLQTKRTLEKLSEQDRLLILLIDLEGQSYAEAAHIIGISESTVVSRLYRARGRFHELFFKS